MWVTEMIVSEPLARYRNIEDDVNAKILCWYGDKHGGSLLTVCAASGIKGA
jgi:hypothetical protein